MSFERNSWRFFSEVKDFLRTPFSSILLGIRNMKRRE